MNDTILAFMIMGSFFFGLIYLIIVLFKSYHDGWDEERNNRYAKEAEEIKKRCISESEREGLLMGLKVKEYNEIVRGLKKEPL